MFRTSSMYANYVQTLTYAHEIRNWSSPSLYNDGTKDVYLCIFFTHVRSILKSFISKWWLFTRSYQFYMQYSWFCQTLNRLDERRWWNCWHILLSVIVFRVQPTVDLEIDGQYDAWPTLVWNVHGHVESSSRNLQCKYMYLNREHTR